LGEREKEKTTFFKYTHTHHTHQKTRSVFCRIPETVYLLKITRIAKPERITEPETTFCTAGFLKQSIS